MSKPKPRKSAFDVIDQKAERIERRTNLAASLATLKQHTQMPEKTKELTLHPQLWDHIQQGVRIWFFVDGTGPLVPSGDYKFEDGKLIWLNKAPLVTSCCFVFAMPSDGKMWVLQDGKWETH